MTSESTREQLMAYRILATGLDRTAKRAADLPIWDLGLQDREGSAGLALAARLPRKELARWLKPGLLGEPSEDSEFTLAWSLRGSPHLHRRADLQKFADAIWPADEKDALARLVGSGKKLVSNGSTGVDGFKAVAAGMRRVVTSTMRKGEASAALTKALPEEFSAFCQPCNSVHVMEMLFRCAALPGGIGLIPGQSATLQPLTPTVDQPAKQGGAEHFVGAFLQLFGAASQSEIAAHLGTQAGQLKSVWPETVAITIDGTKLQTTPDGAASIAAADLVAAKDVIRLIPPGDPLLQPRDRNLLIADKSAWKVLWPAIGPAGVVLAGGEFAGYWRPKKSGRKLTLNVTEFRKISARERRAIEVESELMALVRGVDEMDVVFI